MASPRARSAAPTVSAARATAMSSCTRCHRAPGCPPGPSGTTGVSSRTRRASLRVGSRDGTSSPRAARQVGAHALLAAGHHDGPVGAVAVDHDRLLPLTTHSGRLAAGPGPHRAQRVAVPLLPQGHRAPAGAGGQVPSSSVAPRARAARVAAMAEEKNGPGNGMRPICSATMHISSSPVPPRRTPRAPAGRSSPGRPACDHSAGVIPWGPRPAGAPRRDRTRARARCAPRPAAPAARHRM
jgi:hypothetical protein